MKIAARIDLTPALTFIVPALVLIAAVGILATPYMMVATAAYGILSAGMLVRRKDRKLHALLMSTGMFVDLALVLILQFQREAIQTALSLAMTPVQQAHVAVSSVAVVLYFPVFVLGFLRIQGKLGTRGALVHRNLGVAAFFFRSSGLLLMFSLISRVRV